MDLRRSHPILGTAGRALLIAMACSASAAPLPRDAASANSDGRAERRFSDADLALSDPRSELLPEIGSSVKTQILGTEGNRRFKIDDVQSFDFGQIAGGTPQDMVRSLLTVRRANSPNTGGASRGRNRAASDGLDLGFTSNEWVRESVQGVMTTVLN